MNVGTRGFFSCRLAGLPCNVLLGNYSARALRPSHNADQLICSSFSRMQSLACKRCAIMRLRSQWEDGCLTFAEECLAFRVSNVVTPSCRRSPCSFRRFLQTLSKRRDAALPCTRNRMFPCLSGEKAPLWVSERHAPLHADVLFSPPARAALSKGVSAQQCTVLSIVCLNQIPC